MRVHDIDCCPLRPIGARMPIPSRCLLVELDDRLVLVDTGIGLEDLADPRRRLGEPWVRLSRPTLDPAASAARRVEALGRSTDDVTDIVLTHLDLDHAGGVADFARAKVHVAASELEAADASSSRFGAQRARYQRAHWADADVHAHRDGDVTWHGIEGCRPVPGLESDVLLVPLAGHSAGHRGVAVRTGAASWMLHAGDALFVLPGVRGPMTIRLFDRFIEDDASEASRSRAAIRAVLAAPEVTVVTSHAPDASHACR